MCMLFPVVPIEKKEFGQAITIRASWTRNRGEAEKFEGHPEELLPPVAQTEQWAHPP